MSPRRVNTKPYFADSLTIRMSHCSGKVRPRPTAEPFIAAMIGVRIFQGRGRSAIIFRALRGLLLVEREVRASGLQVGAGGEEPPAAGDDDGADIGVGVQSVKLTVQLDLHRGDEAVAPIGTVEPHRRDVSGRVRR